MSFFARLFRKKKPAAPLVDRKPAPPKPEAPVTRSAPLDDPLAEMRFRARTGDPKLTDHHHSGSFAPKE